MGLIVPNTVELQVLNTVVYDSGILFLKLYSNDYTPIETSTAASFTEVIGGGYVPKSLSPASWVQTAGDPAFAVYPAQTFTFTGPTTGTPNIYGYYVVNSAGTYKWGERFPAIFVPFIPVMGSTIKITPRFEVS